MLELYIYIELYRENYGSMVIKLESQLLGIDPLTSLESGYLGIRS